MSEKKEATKNKNLGFFSRVGAWFKALPGRIRDAFKNMVAELKKVAWPTRQDLINYSLVVVAFVVALAIIVGLLDMASSFLITRLIAL